MKIYTKKYPGFLVKRCLISLVSLQFFAFFCLTPYVYAYRPLIAEVIHPIDLPRLEDRAFTAELFTPRGGGKITDTTGEVVAVYDSGGNVIDTDGHKIGFSDGNGNIMADGINVGSYRADTDSIDKNESANASPVSPEPVSQDAIVVKTLNIGGLVFNVDSKGNVFAGKHVIAQCDNKGNISDMDGDVFAEMDNLGNIFSINSEEVIGNYNIEYQGSKVSGVDFSKKSLPESSIDSADMERQQMSIDPVSGDVTYFDTDGRITKVEKNVEGERVTFTYNYQNGNDQVSSIINNKTGDTVYFYKDEVIVADSEGRLLQKTVTNPATGSQLTMYYDPQTSEYLGCGEHDKDGRVIRIKNAQGDTAADFEYQGSSRELSRKIVYVRDSGGNIIGSRVTMYNESGDPTKTAEDMDIQDSHITGVADSPNELSEDTVITDRYNMMTAFPHEDDTVKLHDIENRVISHIMPSIEGETAFADPEKSGIDDSPGKYSSSDDADIEENTSKYDENNRLVYRQSNADGLVISCDIDYTSDHKLPDSIVTHIQNEAGETLHIGIRTFGPDTDTTDLVSNHLQ
ncbi:MAG: hypothetical protein ABIH89_09185 [Elusimicrobiota bacterium]